VVRSARFEVLGAVEVGSCVLSADLVDEDGARPAVLDSLLSVPKTFKRVFKLGYQLKAVPPRNFSNNLWEILAIHFSNSLLEFFNLFCPGQIERPHVPEVLG
jgi:hypothetical protein